MSLWDMVENRKTWKDSLKRNLTFLVYGLIFLGLGALLVWVFKDTAENFVAVVNFLPIPAETLLFIPIFIGGLLFFVGFVMTMVALFRRFILGDSSYHKDL